MRGWTFFSLIVWLVTRKTNADTNSQLLPALPRAPGIPLPDVICSWARCKGLCQSEAMEDSSICSAILLTSAYTESKCRSEQAMSKYKDCIVPASERSPCKSKKTTLCFSQYHDTATSTNHTEMCWSTGLCEDLSQFCLSNGYTNCSSYGYTTSDLPTTTSRDLSTRTTSRDLFTRNQPVRTPDDLTSIHNVASSFNPPLTTNGSSMNPPITDGLDSLISLVFMIGIVIGILLITLILVVILLLCVIRKYRRKKYGVPKQGENFEMNEGAVYHAIGPELPPNHPTLGKGGNPSNTPGSSCSIEVTMESTQSEAENLQGNENTPYYVLESTDQQYQEGINRDISGKTGSEYINASSTTYVDNQVYNTGFLKAGDHGKNGPDITRVYAQLQRNGIEYSQTDDVTEHANEIPTSDNSISDRPYMALHATDVDSGDVTASEKKAERGESLQHSRKNSSDDVIELRHLTKGPEGPEIKKNKKLNDTDVLQGPNSYDATRVPEQECDAEVNETERQIKTIADNASGPNESPSCNYQQGSTTFPRPKSLKVPNSGSAISKKSKFLSLRFGSKKRNKLSKKKLKRFCSADASDFCLDLNISSPTSPAEEKDDSFFTAAIPIIHAPPQEPQVVPEKLSKSQEAIFDDVNNEPFRNRSLSQPVRKTFSPTLCREYEEIKESWGASYLQVPSQDQK